MATHSSILAWRIPGTEEPSGPIYGVAQSWRRLKRLSSSSRREWDSSQSQDWEMKGPRGGRAHKLSRSCFPVHSSCRVCLHGHREPWRLSPSQQQREAGAFWPTVGWHWRVTFTPKLPTQLSQVLSGLLWLLPLPTPTSSPFFSQVSILYQHLTRQTPSPHLLPGNSLL